MWAIVPIKQFQLAKQRLAPGLDATERAGLMRAMAEDVLDCVGRTPGITRILVVSREPEAAALAAAVGAELLVESEGGLIAAVTEGAAAAARAGARGILIVPGDLPLADPEDLQQVLEAHRDAPAVTLVADAAGEGTNCLACTPADLIDFRFGAASCGAHQRAARDAGVEPTLLAVPALALDVDTPADLAAFAGRARGGHAVAFLEASGIASRLRSAPGSGADAASLEALERTIDGIDDGSTERGATGHGPTERGPTGQTARGRA